MKRKFSQGFTVIELIVVIVFLGAAAVLLLVQRSDLNASQRDNDRKTAINAMYYNLEEVYFAKNGFYPSKIDDTVLTVMDPKLFTDPEGTKINDDGSDYHYDALNCQNGQCKSYKLSADMEKEAKYVKKSRNN